MKAHGSRADTHEGRRVTDVEYKSADTSEPLASESSVSVITLYEVSISDGGGLDGVVGLVRRSIGSSGSPFEHGETFQLAQYSRHPNARDSTARGARDGVAAPLLGLPLGLHSVDVL